MLEISGLSAGYPGKPVLQDICVTFPPGKITAILGPNGCGKSTLLKALCGILPAQSGQVFFKREDLLALSPKLRARKLSYLAQSRQIPDIPVGKLVLHGRFPYLGYPRRYRKEDYACAEAAMAAMGILEWQDTLLQNLSGGQRQKAYLAMALAQDTPVILLDEPTTYLDIAHQLQLLEYARMLAKQGKTVVLVIHDLPHAFERSDNIILMEAGKIITQGTTEEIFASGLVDRVFGVGLRRTQTEKGWLYYCEERK